MVNTDNLVSLHDKTTTIRRHKRLLSELFYLCINESFEQTIIDTRGEFQRIAEINGVDLVFPVLPENAPIIRRELLESESYRRTLNNISEKHRYYHSSFIRNYNFVDAVVPLNNRFNILENIIFFNDPFPTGETMTHYKNRSGYLEIAEDEIEGPYIKMHFDLGTTKKEILDIIDKDFPETQQLQVENYNLAPKGYRKDSSLLVKSHIVKFVREGLSDTAIVVTLENMGILNEDDFADKIRMHRSRIASEINRFNPND